ncbi:MAG: DUF1365 domain-containing protein [Sciscionella sp.]
MSASPTEPGRGSARVCAPACYDVQITHHRREPLAYAFRNGGRTWLVDLDAVPRLPRGLGWLCRFDSGDHFGDPDAALRANLDAMLAESGVRRPARALMLANPRVLGYVFNPLTLFYCYDGRSQLSHVVAEVRNTYGERHCYLLRPDGAGRAATDKVLYVSPFHPVAGRYEIRVPEPGARLAVTITLRQPDTRRFTASMTGTLRASATLWSALRAPLATRAVMFHIKRHGITLYLKGLRPASRRRPPA